ncbi:MAG: hypothetical protein KJ597_05635, partial [Nanoarchaeota archaeon]|nr:hypothetical protein [Nanoarchaeota archaeon]
ANHQQVNHQKVDQKVNINKDKTVKTVKAVVSKTKRGKSSTKKSKSGTKSSKKKFNFKEQQWKWFASLIIIILIVLFVQFKDYLWLKINSLAGIEKTIFYIVGGIVTLAFMILLVFMFKPRKAEVSSGKAISSVKSKISISGSGTEIDTLFQIVEKKGKISFEEMERTFKVTKALVEDWAKILESHNLAVIHYPAFGSPELRKVEEVEEKKEEAK